ncbi:hypothetical protein SAMN05421770_102506 [Granulicella rosea]|uniref:Uncharacterized protein n=1 Tax=Granulicella rosea TaxID=474952 RepID=A0A239HQF4_9BACT|nr:hypothetical protein [Granulicella rosea]SNS83516.1 hypothetical protein SAMN05421770_102506 [Granulicella rosea]
MNYHRLPTTMLFLATSLSAFAQPQKTSGDRLGTLVGLTPSEADLQVIDSKGKPQRLVFAIGPGAATDAVKTGDMVKIVYSGEGDSMVATAISSVGAAQGAVQTTGISATTMSLGQAQAGPPPPSANTQATSINLGIPAPPSVNGQPPIRIAVLDFKYTDPNGSDKSPMQTDDSPWTELAEKVAAKLGIDAGFTVVHGKGEDHVTVSLAPGQTGDSDQSTAAKIGALLGVDAVLIGSIEDSLLAPHASAMTKDGKSAPEKEISLHARLVDARSGQTLSVVNGVGYTPPMDSAKAANCSGSKSEKADCLARNAPTPTWTNTADFQVASSQAVDSLVGDLATGGDSPMTGSVGTIFDADGGQTSVLADEGKLPAIGTRLIVTRPSGLTKDANGSVVRPTDLTIGYLTVSSIDGSLAIGHFEGSMQPKVGDSVSIAK